MFFDFKSMSQAYPELLYELQTAGRQRSPRGQATFEIPNLTFRLHNPALCYPDGIGRRYGPAIAAAEAACLVGGVTDPQLMISVGSNFKRFLDGGALHGTYGPRIRGQMQNVVKRLREDADTRQAIVQVWDARYDQAGWTPKDLPCTLMFGFAIYDNQLEMSTTMRSNDIWWGVAHDVPMFTALQHSVASALQLPVGPYTHTAYSFHMYERDLPEAHKLWKYDHSDDHSIGGGFFGGGDWEQAASRARMIVDGELPPAPTPYEQWSYDQLLPHVEVAKASRDL